MIAKRLMPGYIQGPVNVIDVRDVAVALIKAAERGRVGERYIIGNWNTTQQDLNKLIAKVAGVRAPVIPIPFLVAQQGAKVGEWVTKTILRKSPFVPAFFVEIAQAHAAVRLLERPARVGLSPKLCGIGDPGCPRRGLNRMGMCKGYCHLNADPTLNTQFAGT